MNANPPHLTFFHLTSSAHHYLTVSVSEEQAKEHVRALCSEMGEPQPDSLTVAVAYRDQWEDFNGYGHDPLMQWEDITAPAPLLIEAARVHGFPGVSDGANSATGCHRQLWSMCEPSQVLDGMVHELLCSGNVVRFTARTSIGAAQAGQES